MDRKLNILPEKKPNVFHLPEGWFHHLVVSEAVLSLLLALSFVGVAYTDIAGVRSLNFWL